MPDFETVRKDLRVRIAELFAATCATIICARVAKAHGQVIPRHLLTALAELEKSAGQFETWINEARAVAGETAMPDISALGPTVDLSA